MTKIFLLFKSEKKLTMMINILTTIVYIYLFRRVYVDYLYGFFGFYGYRLTNQSQISTIITNILLFIPILYYKAHSKLSDVFSIVIYVLIYVPTLVALQYYYDDYSFVVPYQVLYFFALMLFFSASRNHISNEKYRIKKRTIKYKPFITLGIIAIIGVFIVFRGNIRLVSFSDVYDLRWSSGDTIADSIPFFGYLYMWMANTLCPLFVALGLLLHKKKLVILGFFMALLYYMTCGMKGTLVVPIIAYIFFKKLDNPVNIKFIYPFLVSGVFFAYLLLLLFPSNEAIGMLISIILMRTYGIASLLTPMYIDVFQSYPYTYYCHIGILNKIFGLYPFDNPSLGTAISEAYGGYDTESVSNANFLVTDGIAAGGLVGLFIISVLFYYFLCHLNKLSNNYRFNFVISAMAGIIMAFSNVSIFTTILSCGLILLLVFFRYVKFNKQYNARN